MTMLDDARALAARLPDHTAAHEAKKRLDDDVIEALRAGGMLGALLPRALGGAELEAPAYVELLELLAAGDAATGWVVMTASTSTFLARYLPREIAAQIWAQPAPLLAGVFAPGGKLTDDGVLTGRWPYGSGCRHAAYFAVGAMAGKRHVVCVVRADDPAATIADNWDTLGLAGTGSHDLVITEARVPATHVTSVFEATPWPDGAIARLPLFGLLSLGVAACGVGIASAAIAHAGAQLASTDAPPSTALAAYGELRGRLDAARASLRAAASAAQRAAEADGVSTTLRGELRLAACHVAAACVEVTRGAFHLGGGAAVRAGHPLQRALRDAEMVLTHRMVAAKVIPAATRAALGGAAPPDL